MKADDKVGIISKKIFIYNLGDGLTPLDWEVCFLSVEEYKLILAQKYRKDEIHNARFISSLDLVYEKIDAILNFALIDFSDSFPGDIFRCPPMVMPIPCGNNSNAAEFAIILKRHEDGDTLVYSPYPLPHLE